MNNLDEIAEFNSSPDLIEKLYQYGIQKNYDAGSVILNENAHIRSIPIVMSGILRVIKTEDDGREILLYYIKSGESCIMSFLGGMHHETSKVKAEVEEAAEILFLPIDKVSLLKNRYRLTAKRIGCDMCK
jgi:cAMP-binding proteins - catabolite gene activator and regulatory subunit of cAMP-dependent protein kinases